VAESQDQPLSVEEAKARLLEVAAEATPAAWVREHPWSAVGLAFGAGLLAGLAPPERRPAADTLARMLSAGLLMAARLGD